MSTLPGLLSSSLSSSLSENSNSFSLLSLLVPLPFILLSFRATPPEVKQFNGYLVLSTLHHFWILLTIVLYSLPSLGKSNFILSLALFFPTALATLAILALVTFCKSKYVDFTNDLPNTRPHAWYYPLRRLLTRTLVVTLIVCATQAHCWNRDTNEFKTDYATGGPICAACFEDHHTKPEHIIRVWMFTIVWMSVDYAVRGVSFDRIVINGENLRSRGRLSTAVSPGKARGKSNNCSNRTAAFNRSDSKDYDADGYESDSIADQSSHIPDLDDLDPPDPTNKKIRPTNTEVMVPWYSLLLVFTAVDILISLKVFLGRFDARTLQPANHVNWGGKRKKKLGNSNAADRDGAIDDEDSDKLDSELSGCVFDYSQKRGSSPADTEEEEPKELWFDWMADCGDGFNSSYQVARVLADPMLSVMNCNRKGVGKTLPRGEFLVVGGDLAYPDPNEYNFERRFFRTFEDAMPPPSSFRRENISVIKPALPVRGWSFSDCFKSRKSATPPPSEDDDAHELLKTYKGPQAFVLPGNHDWFDGLGTFQRFIMSRDWLGGWLMPQERSYFCIMLPQGWWIFGVDLALSEDIDVEQYKFFADIAMRRVGPDDAVIMMTHEPYWVLDTSEQRGEEEDSKYEFAEKNLRELMHTHLKGKVRCRIAGDLHHYTRHIPVKKRGAEQKRPVAPGSKAFSETYTPDMDGGNLAAAAKLMALKKREQEQAGAAGHDASTDIPQHDSSDAIESLPEMIVSGGGGAFLHPTHTFAKSLSVNFGKRKNHPYVRTVAYPSDATSFRLSFLNIWQFRWRNWRMDILLGILYIGIVHSLLPMCGIYDSFAAAALNGTVMAHVQWYFSTMVYLSMSIYRSTVLSCAVFSATLYGFYQYCDEAMPSKYRIPWGFGHGAAHIIAAMTCAIFIELAIEWSLQVGFVTATTADATTAQSAGQNMMSEWNDKFGGVWEYAPSIFSNEAAEAAKEHFFDPNRTIYLGGGIDRPILYAYDLIAIALSWLFENVPLVKFFIYMLDLPTLIASEHASMCQVLCAGGAVECMGSKSALLWNEISRFQVFSYTGGFALYFLVIAMPATGTIFGTWLAMTLTVFNGQWNEGFSSLRIQHWKNVLRCHITKNGDLEIYAIGLDRVPKKWVMDEKWGGTKAEMNLRERERTSHQLKEGKSVVLDGDTPSFAWKKPSKWRPEKPSKKHSPRLIDFTVIRKRPWGSSGDAEDGISSARELAVNPGPSLNREASM
jgi:hypothetical protein